MTALRHIARRTSPRLIGGILIWGVMETAALRRARQQRRLNQADTPQLRA